MTSPVNVDVKLGVNKFNVDEDSPHIILKTDPDKQALEVLIKACPAGLYKKQDDGSVRFDYAGCPGVRNVPHSRARYSAGKVGIPAWDIWRGVSLRLISTRLCTRRPDKTR